MLKKIGYFYLFAAAGCLLFGLVGLGVGIETEAGFLIGLISVQTFSWILCTVPLWLLTIVIRGMLTRDEYPPRQ
jgi:hypothetical protein